MLLLGKAKNYFEKKNNILPYSFMLRTSPLRFAFQFWTFSLFKYFYKTLRDIRSNDFMISTFAILFAFYGSFFLAKESIDVETEYP